MRSIRSGRRYRFGWFAAFVVGGYLAAVLVFGVVGLVSGDDRVLRLLVLLQGEPGAGWQVLLLLLVGVVQGWALWQILRGRVAGEIGEQGRAVRLLRVALYANVALFWLDSLVAYLPWWTPDLEGVGQLALVVLFYRVLDGASRPLRLIALVAGILDAAGSIGEEVFDLLGLRSLEGGFEIVQLGGLTWLLWMLLTVVAQAGDGRWGRGTVWSGTASMVLPFFVAPLAFAFIDDYSAFAALLGMASLFLPVWLARSAHDLAGPHTRRVRTKSTALTASALIPTFLYGRWTAARARYRMATACVAALATLCLLPVADQVRGPVTSRADCEPPERGRSANGEPRTPPPTGKRAFVCAVRTSGVLPSARSTPDQALLAYGHRLCGVYTRNDPGELARVREIDVRTLSGLLADICPRAAEDVQAASAADKREMLEQEAEEQRKCDEAPRHRPLIRPVSVSVHGEPLWTDYGVLESYEPGDNDSDPFEDGLFELLHKNELVAAIPGHLMVDVHSDFSVCVTTETYRRRPPVETRGWNHVVEVGYRSPTGEIRLTDPTGGPELPNLAVRGRGDYRIRVHYAWFPWKGEKLGGQRLLIMAYPGRGDNVIVHRKRTRP